MPLPGVDASGNFLEHTGSHTRVNAPVAAAGSVIANAAALSLGFTVVTGANDAKGVILPAASPGDVVEIYSSQATNGLLVYPPVNGTINDGSANSSINIEGKSAARFVASSGTNWAAIYTVNA